MTITTYKDGKWVVLSKPLGTRTKILNLFWAIVAIVIGSVAGGVLTALHAVQGPRLGVPQMIQSRGQFGFYFGVVLFLMGIVLDVGYMGGGLVVGAESLQGVIPGLPIQAWIVIFAVPCIVLAIWGYRLIHAVQPYLVVIMTGSGSPCWA